MSDGFYKLKSRSKAAPKIVRTPKKTYRVAAKVWVYAGPAAWHFVTVPTRVSRDIQKTFGFAARGWGSLPVEVVIGKSVWSTSIFPDKKAGAYLLPLKAEIRKKEKIEEGSQLSIELRIIP